jgi:dihydrodipicolinate synthase/N-acetylneuraminate lyase
MKILDKAKKQLLADGIVIPAHPLALDRSRKIDIESQKALTRYYIDSGAGGIAVGVHTTQFEIRDKKHGLYAPVLKLARDEVANSGIQRPFIKVAGIVGATDQAVHEAEIAVDLDYDLGLVSMGGLSDYSSLDLIKRAEKIAEVMPVFGFYLQPAVGGQVLSYDFWKDFCEISQVQAIKMAPFNRYQTLDVVRAVCHSSRHKEIALYTGNDDNIVVDLLTKFQFYVDGELRIKEIVGGLLGHWAVWTKKAVELLTEIKNIKEIGDSIPSGILTKGVAITDANAALFDAANDFKGCIAGIHEVLRRHGLLKGIWCLNPVEQLSSGQSDEITRVCNDYPFLNDNDFVAENLDKWLGRTS